MDNWNQDYSSQNPNGPEYPNPAGPVPGKGQAIASLVLGICAFFVPYGGVAVAIVGLVLGLSAKKKLAAAGAAHGIATAGIVLSIISLVCSVLIVILCSAALALFGMGAIAGY